MRDDAKRSSFTMKGKKRQEEFHNIQRAVERVRRARTISDSQCEKRRALQFREDNGPPVGMRAIRARANSNHSIRMKHKSTTGSVSTLIGYWDRVVGSCR